MLVLVFHLYMVNETSRWFGCLSPSVFLPLSECDEAVMNLAILRSACAELVSTVHSMLITSGSKGAQHFVFC